MAALITLSLTGCGGNDQSKPKTTVKKDSAVVYLGPRSEPLMGFDPMKGFANVDGISIFHSNLLKLNEDLLYLYAQRHKMLRRTTAHCRRCKVLFRNCG